VLSIIAITTITMIVTPLLQWCFRRINSESTPLIMIRLIRRIGSAACMCPDYMTLLVAPVGNNGSSDVGTDAMSGTKNKLQMKATTQPATVNQNP